MDYSPQLQAVAKAAEVCVNDAFVFPNGFVKREKITALRDRLFDLKKHGRPDGGDAGAVHEPGEGG